MRERYKKGATQPDRPSKQIANTKGFSYSKIQKHLKWKKKTTTATVALLCYLSPNLPQQSAEYGWYGNVH